MQHRAGEDYLRHLESAVAEERQRIDDDRETLHRGDRIARKTSFADQRHAAQLERGAGKMAQKVHTQRFEIERRHKHGIGFALDDPGNLLPQQHRRREQHQQQDGDRRNDNLQNFLHGLSTFRANTTVSTSSKPVL